MNESLPGFRLSTARRPGSGPSPVIIAILAIGLLTVLLVVLRRREPEPPPEPVPATVTPLPTATATATATVLSEQSSGWVTVSTSEPTPTPWRPPPPPTRRPTQPPPRLSECVAFTWSSIQVFRPSAQVVVEIRADNRCDRDLGPLDLWFQITGYRDGAMIQTVRGHPFEGVRRGRGVITTIGLPGSQDWYDEIVVEVLD